MQTEGFREEVLNVNLARLLGRQGVVSIPERLVRSFDGKRKMPDVLVEYQGMNIIIEGKIDDNPSARQFAEEQALSRINQGISRIVMAVLYPAYMREAPDLAVLEDYLTRRSMQVLIVSEAGKEGWSKSNLSGLSELLRRTHELLIQEDVVSLTKAELEAGVNRFAQAIVSLAPVIQKAAELLGVSAVSTTQTVTKKGIDLSQRQSVGRITGLTIANAMIFQDVLSNSREVESLRTSLSKDDPITALARHWEYIWKEIDYIPIFQIASELLNALPAGPDTYDAIRFLGDRALGVLNRQAALRHDLMGRVYHTLLADKKYLGTYYTSVPSATLLLKTALSPKRWALDWSKPEEIRKLRIADPSCGTGTLLMATAEAVTDNYISECFGEEVVPDMDLIHKILMEELIYGYDILPSALHLTASTLALRSSKAYFDHTNLFVLPFGGPSDRLGSIDFLRTTQVEIFADAFHAGSTQITGQGKKTHKFAPLPELDLCVMNPPFTRSTNSNKLFGSLPENERNRLQTKLAALLNEHDIEASSTSGLGSVFVALGDHYLKEGGRLALVLPRALLSGVAWKKTRALISRKYVLENIIVSHDPLRWNFSENTELSEVLIVARKESNGSSIRNGNQKVTCLNLWTNPDTVSSALFVSRELHKDQSPDLATGQGAQTIQTSNQIFGEVVSMPWRELKNNSWLLPCAFAQNDLTRIGYFLQQGRYHRPGYGAKWDVPLKPLSDLVQFGPDGRDIHDGYEQTSFSTPFQSYWGMDAKQCLTLLQEPNGFLQERTTPIPGRPRRPPELLWPKAGTILIPACIWLNTQAIAAMVVTTPVLSNVWWPLRFSESDRRYERALAMWLNCSLGLTLLLIVRGETRGSWMKFKKPNLQSMLVLDVKSLRDGQLDILNSEFEAIAHEPLLPFPQMKTDQIRKRIDDAISKALDLPDLTSARELIGREPIVTLKEVPHGTPIKQRRARIK